MVDSIRESLRGDVIVTSGWVYMDIDAYAGCVAYAELLNLQGIKARAVCTAKLNESVKPALRSCGSALEINYEPNINDRFVLVDISDPDFMEKFADADRVVEVIDHHPGFEDLWRKKLGDDAQIEPIGAACTLVYERWRDAGMLDQISSASARLLMSGILDNTIYFGAKITTQRDRAAYEDLEKRVGANIDWAKQYFSECQEEVMRDVAGALERDTKELSWPSLSQRVIAGQLTVWDGRILLREEIDTIKQKLSSMGPNWYMNIISVGERCSYFICEDEYLKSWLERLLDIKFENIVAMANRPWLRKEMMQQDLDRMRGEAGVPGI